MNSVSNFNVNSKNNLNFSTSLLRDLPETQNIKPQPNSAAAHFFAEMKRFGFQDKEIVAVSSELLSQLTEDIRNRLLNNSEQN